jgi:hypothetical protein
MTDKVLVNTTSGIIDFPNEPLEPEESRYNKFYELVLTYFLNFFSKMSNVYFYNHNFFYKYVNENFYSCGLYPKSESVYKDFIGKTIKSSDLKFLSDKLNLSSGDCNLMLRVYNERKSSEDISSIIAQTIAEAFKELSFRYVVQVKQKNGKVSICFKIRYITVSVSGKCYPKKSLINLSYDPSKNVMIIFKNGVFRLDRHRNYNLMGFSLSTSLSIERKILNMLATGCNNLADQLSSIISSFFVDMCKFYLAKDKDLYKLFENTPKNCFYLLKNVELNKKVLKHTSSYNKFLEKLISDYCSKAKLSVRNTNFKVSSKKSDINFDEGLWKNWLSVYYAIYFGDLSMNNGYIIEPYLIAKIVNDESTPITKELIKFESLTKSYSKLLDIVASYILEKNNDKLKFANIECLTSDLKMDVETAPEFNKKLISDGLFNVEQFSVYKVSPSLLKHAVRKNDYSSII